MIVDVHTHCWPPGAFTQEFIDDVRRMRLSAVNLETKYATYQAGLPNEDVISIVFGGKARRSGIWINDEDVAQHVAQDPEHLIGFLSLDPTQPGWQDEMPRRA